MSSIHILHTTLELGFCLHPKSTKISLAYVLSCKWWKYRPVQLINMETRFLRFSCRYNWIKIHPPNIKLSMCCYTGHYNGHSLYCLSSQHELARIIILYNGLSLCCTSSLLVHSTIKGYIYNYTFRFLSIQSVWNQNSE